MPIPTIVLFLLCAAAERDGVTCDVPQSPQGKVSEDGSPASFLSVSADAGSSALPATATPISPGVSAATGHASGGVNWAGLIQASGRFLAVEHAFRILTEPGTRSGLRGSFIGNYGRAVGSLHGWADGDEFYVNYIGHPMQGSVAGFLWTGNDNRYGRAEFGKSTAYWKGRLRGAAFSFVYSTQFEIGTVSEASIGSIQSTPPQQGFVDHVITPTLGLGWMIAEDVMDRFVVKRIEAATSNRWIRLLARGGMNPTRTFANVLRGAAPWHRDTRAGISRYRAIPRDLGAQPAPGPIPEVPDGPGPPPFELEIGPYFERTWGNREPVSCVGGGAAAGLRLAPAWQFIVDVRGCNLLGLDGNATGDSLAYMAGPRWNRSGSSPWAAHWQFLIGGNKITQERLSHEREKVAAQRAAPQGKAAQQRRPDADNVEANGFAISTAGGLDYKVSRALAIRVAELSYRRSWAGPLWGKTYSDTIRFVTGVVIRMGTW